VGFYPFRGQDASFTLKQSYHDSSEIRPIRPRKGMGRLRQSQGSDTYFCEEVGGHGGWNPRTSERTTRSPEVISSPVGLVPRNALLVRKSGSVLV
jgi:hypothetical protein